MRPPNLLVCLSSISCSNTIRKNQLALIPNNSVVHIFNLHPHVAGGWDPLSLAGQGHRLTLIDIICRFWFNMCAVLSNAIYKSWRDLLQYSHESGTEITASTTTGITQTRQVIQQTD